ncbi:MAG: enoyl-CoA hydratase-related protein [Dehalococcoidia bacterium]
MSGPKVLTERRGRAFVVTINRPDQRNCVDGETAQLLNDAADEFRADDGLDFLILTGAGELAFCSGADLKNVGSLTERPGQEEAGPMGVSRITDLHKPVIGAVEGYCTAGGLELACWCDFRIAGESAQFGVLNRRWGVPLLDGGTVRLPQIVGLGNALYLIETGAQIDARHAQRMGLVQEVVPAGKTLERALEIAATISTYPQPAMRNDRRSAIESAGRSLDDALQHEAEVHRSTRNPETGEWLRRFAAGERPQPIRPPE